MSERDASAIAFVLGGEAIENHDPFRALDGWLVLFTRADGRVVALTDTCVEEYYDLDAFVKSQCYAEIHFD